MSEVNRKTLMHRAMPLILGGSLVKQILVALVLGALTAYFAPQAAVSLGFLGTVFVSALKAVAPVLVFVLVVAAVAGAGYAGKQYLDARKEKDGDADGGES